MHIKHLANSIKPRERYLQKGSQSLSDAELIAILLGSGNKNQSVLEISQHLLSTYTLQDIVKLSPHELSKFNGIGIVGALKIKAALDLQYRIKQSSKPQLISAKEVYNYLSHLTNLDREHIVALYVNKKKQLIKEETISIGTIDESVIHPRELYKTAISCGAYALILAHNHPSGDPNPSFADKEITSHLRKTSQFLGIPLIDHVIIADGYYSFLEDGAFIDV